MLVLGIESTCDESAVSAVEIESNGKIKHIHKELVATHNMQPYQGVVPEAAARQHFQLLPQMIQEFRDLFPHITHIASAHAPGLMGGLMMGVAAGKSLATALQKPFIAVDHLQAHALSPLIENPELSFPYLCLLVSGGHTMLLAVNDWSKIRLLAQTRDDAMGEWFDKIAKRLGLGFPGGRLIEQLAAKGDPNNFTFKSPKCKSSDLDFSFSGLKTAFLQIIEEAEANGTLDAKRNDICASLQATATRICVEKLTAASKQHPSCDIAMVGGVASNHAIRTAITNFASQNNKRAFFPSLRLCTDNATMIAFAAYEKALNGNCDLAAGVFNRSQIIK